MSNEPRFRKEIFEQKVYDLGIPRIENMVILDIGANTGLFDEYIHTKASVIYAIEPYKPLFNKLVNRLTELSLSVVIPFNIGIAATSGHRVLHVNGGDGGSSIVFGDGPDIEVEVMSLYDFVSNHTVGYIDLLKIDCEGAEDEIFKSESFKEIAPVIDNIVGEVHSDTDIKKPLIDAGYTYTDLGNGIFKAQRI